MNFLETFGRRLSGIRTKGSIVPEAKAVFRESNIESVELNAEESI